MFGPVTGLGGSGSRINNLVSKYAKGELSTQQFLNSISQVYGNGSAINRLSLLRASGDDAAWNKITQFIFGTPAEISGIDGNLAEALARFIGITSSEVVQMLVLRSQNHPACQFRAPPGFERVTHHVTFIPTKQVEPKIFDPQSDWQDDLRFLLDKHGDLSKVALLFSLPEKVLDKWQDGSLEPAEIFIAKLKRLRREAEKPQDVVASEKKQQAKVTSKSSTDGSPDISAKTPSSKEVSLTTARTPVIRSESPSPSCSPQKSINGAQSRQETGMKVERIPYKTEAGSLVNAARKDLGIGLDQLGKLLYPVVGYQSLYNWQRGMNSPRRRQHLDQLQKLAECKDISEARRLSQSWREDSNSTSESLSQKLPLSTHKNWLTSLSIAELLALLNQLGSDVMPTSIEIEGTTHNFKLSITRR